MRPTPRWTAQLSLEQTFQVKNGSGIDEQFSVRSLLNWAIGISKLNRWRLVD